VQELTRMMAESVNDVATVQRNLQRTVEATEDDLIAQARQTRELQRDLLRTRMVEFEGISDRLYRVVRLASKGPASRSSWTSPAAPSKWTAACWTA
jgi:chemosensory pili system protein ChpA (sensor histidine kinase/response regulator)